MEIRYIKHEEWSECMNLCWRTFLEFEADDYSPEGVKNFFDFVTSVQIEDMFCNGSYKAIGAFLDGKVVGFLGFRNVNHISLLFVDKAFHHNGIATAMVELMKLHLKGIKRNSATVYSSPYATGFYHKIGFVDIDEVQTKDGIIYTPMLMEF